MAKACLRWNLSGQKPIMLLLILLMLSTFVKGQETTSQKETQILEELPTWFVKSETIDGFVFMTDYVIENRMESIFLEADFNGDGEMDLVVAIRHTATNKVGFAIVHGGTNEAFIIGAGTKVKNGLSDDLDFYDLWQINTQRINEAGVGEETGTGDKGELILDHPSLRLEKSDIGGGLIYWDGKQYAYFHQTC